MSRGKKINQSKTIFQLSDQELTLLSVEKDTLSKKFFISQFEKIPLAEGIIARGEILRPEEFIKILSGFAPFIQNKTIDVILPDELFTFFEKRISGLRDNKKKNKRAILSALSHSQESTLQTHVFEFDIDSRETKTGRLVFFFGIPHQIYTDLSYVFQKAGFELGSIISETLSFRHLMPKEEKETLILVGQKSTRVADFSAQFLKKQQNFQISYNHLVSDIVQFPHFSQEDAEKILQEYGVLRAHLDEKVYRKLIRSLGPLLDYLSKRKITKSTTLQLVFTDRPLRGFVDVLFKTLGVPITEFHVLYQKTFPFQEVLDIHKEDTYLYHAAIAQALRFWKE